MAAEHQTSRKQTAFLKEHSNDSFDRESAISLPPNWEKKKETGNRSEVHQERSLAVCLRSDSVSGRDKQRSIDEKGTILTSKKISRQNYAPNNSYSEFPEAFKSIKESKKISDCKSPHHNDTTTSSYVARSEEFSGAVQQTSSHAVDAEKAAQNYERKPDGSSASHTQVNRQQTQRGIWNKSLVSEKTIEPLQKLDGCKNTADSSIERTCQEKHQSAKQMPTVESLQNADSAIGQTGKTLLELIIMTCSALVF